MPTQDKEIRPEKISWKELVSGTLMFVLMIVLAVSLGLYVRETLIYLPQALNHLGV